MENKPLGYWLQCYESIKAQRCQRVGQGTSRIPYIFNAMFGNVEQSKRAYATKTAQKMGTTDEHHQQRIIMSNEITIKIDVSDSLLAKLMSLVAEPEPSQLPMGIPMGLLGALQPPTASPTPPKERAKVGFKTK